MSNPSKARMAEIRNALAAMFPARAVTRDLKEQDKISKSDLTKGIYSIVSRGAAEFTNAPGYSAKDGKHDIILFGDFKLSENVAPSEIEDLELDMLAEVAQFCDQLPATLCQLNLIEFIQSGQVYHPYGWIVCRLRYEP